ncbi:c-type cytochrome [Pseudoroseomonas wenyumeiae]
MHPDANGHVYVLDRLSGALLSAEAFLSVNATEGLDPAQGVLRRNPAKQVRSGGTTTGICPAHPGAVGGAAAYSPRTGLLYIPARRLCMDLEARDTTFIPGTPFTGANLRQMPAPGLYPGALVAWDLGAARVAWTKDEALPLEGGALATAGGLVFYGTAEGVLKALDAKTGAELWRFQAASGIIAPPVSYQGPDGRQFVAVLAETGGFHGAAAGRRLTSATQPPLRAGPSPCAACRSRRRPAACSTSLPCHDGEGTRRHADPARADHGRLQAGGARHPPGPASGRGAGQGGGAARRHRRPPARGLPRAGQPLSQQCLSTEPGKRLYEWFNCRGCHADGGGNTGPALLDGWWRYGPDAVSIFVSIRDGRPNGMPAFRDRLTTEQIWQLTGYIQSMGATAISVAAPSRSDRMQSRPAENRAPATFPAPR